MKNNAKILTIALPTFNEKDNVIPLLNKIKDAFEEKEYDYEILFIDDSTDETPDIIKKQMKIDEHIRLIHRMGKERTGLATAFIRGFKEAQGEYICCLDSDLQHPPEKIPQLLKTAITDNADIVAATRYAKGGSAEGLGSLRTFYGIYRRLVSLGMKYFTQILFIPTRKTSDPLGGFFLFKKSLLENKTLQPKGFKILVEILMRTDHQKVSEIPYVFLSRENDDSKATLGQGWEFFKHLWFIFRTVPEAGRFLKFCLVGGSGVIVNLGVLFVLVEFFSFGENTAWFFAVILSIFSNFILNNIFTYSDKKSPSRGESIRRLSYFYITSLFGMILNFLTYRASINLGLHYMLAALVGILAATFLNFYLATKVVWRIK